MGFNKRNCKTNPLCVFVCVCACARACVRAHPPVRLGCRRADLLHVVGGEPQLLLPPTVALPPGGHRQEGPGWFLGVGWSHKPDFRFIS